MHLGGMQLSGSTLSVGSVTEQSLPAVPAALESVPQMICKVPAGGTYTLEPKLIVYTEPLYTGLLYTVLFSIPVTFLGRKP